MGYKYAPITVDLSEFGEGLYAKCLHPKLQPNGSFKAQQRAMTGAVGKLPPQLLQQVVAGELDFDKLSPEMKAQLAPLLIDQLEAQDDLVAACVLEWNLTDIYTGEALGVPLATKDAKGPLGVKAGNAIFERIPGGIVAAIYARLQKASQEETDPNS